MKSFCSLSNILSTVVVLVFCATQLLAQTIPTPTILEVVEDDHVATVYWNSKTQTYHSQYDPDKQAGIYSYMVEWGTVQNGFTNSFVTPYRVTMLQPLDPGVMYKARVYNLDEHGNKSIVSNEITFQHNSVRVDSMRQRLKGFFDDMNTPMGAFDETKWNQAYSGCMKIGRVSQHINNQYHGHNVQSSSYCDRGVATSRVRENFDFTNRTGTIEFDLDGAQRGRQFWYLDIMPVGRKRDLTGHISLHAGSNPSQADPPNLLRILQRGSKVTIHYVDDQGYLQTFPNLYENGACGESLNYCGGENLSPAINVRRRWKIELSKSRIRIFINQILVVDCSFITPNTPTGLPYEVAQVNWLTFSYNTPKENFLLSMIHWDNFGFDAPPGYQQGKIIHNYTDGILGTESPRANNDFSNGMWTTLVNPGSSLITIPDMLKDIQNNDPLTTELIFTIQGSDYNWTAGDSILINGHQYSFPQPTSSIPGFDISNLTKSGVPHSVLLPIDPAHLITGVNEVDFYLNHAKILNVHIELEFPIDDAPTYTQPQQVYADHLSKLMGFWTVANTMGPGIIFRSIDGYSYYSNEFEKIRNPTNTIDLWYVKQAPVSEIIPIILSCNSVGQLAATGKAKGITHYEVLIDSVVVQTIYTNIETPVAGFVDTAFLDTELFANGLHQLAFRAFDVEGNVSTFDAFETSSKPGEYIPVIIDIQNDISDVDVYANEDHIILYPNPSAGFFKIEGSLNSYEILILDTQGVIHQNLSTSNSEVVVDISNLPSGLYFVRIENLSNNLLSLEKIIKQ